MKKIRLPSGFGSIRKIGGKRSKPYAVHPPATERDPETGLYIRPKALCYVSSWYVGMSVLSAYHAGTYRHGDEIRMESELKAIPNETMLYDFCRRLLTNFAVIQGVAEPEGLTVEEIYLEYMEWKFGEHAPKKLSRSAKHNTEVAYSHIKPLQKRPICALTLVEMQNVINSIDRRRYTVKSVIQLLRQLYDYAIPRDYCSRNLARYLVMPSKPEYRHFDAYADAELEILWQHADRPIIAFILIMCFSGFRLSAYDTLQVDLEQRFFRGGIKTSAGKDRVVPIHSAILPLVKKYGVRPTVTQNTIRKSMRRELSAIGVRYLSPHSCRHTFSRLCETYGVNETDRKRLLGHSLPDLTNSVYGHRTLEELRTEIEKILCPSVSIS